MGSYQALIIGAALAGAVIGLVLTVLGAGGPLVAVAVGFAVALWLVVWTSLRVKRSALSRDGL
jgi:hypothetical protein